MRRNWARGLLSLEAAFVIVGGLSVALAPEEACSRMAALRGLGDGPFSCPSYVGAQPVFEMYTFSLGKHQALIAALFVYFALFGRSKAVINAGLVYLPVATLLDAVPVYTWFSEHGLVTAPVPGILVLAGAFTLVAAISLPLNMQHPEWAAA